MKTNKVFVSGENLKDLPSKLKEVLSEIYPDSYFRIIGSAHIFAINEYFFWINSTLVTIITLDISEEGKCEIDVVTGGGSVGLLGFTWGAEVKSNKIVLGIIRELCAKNSLQFKEVG